RRVGREEVIAVTDPDYQRAPGPSAHDAPGFLRRNYGDGVGPVEFGDRRSHRAYEIAATFRMPVGVDEVGDYFGVGLRDEHVTGGLQTLAQRLVVLDDSVVHDGDFAVGDMRMGVGL